MKSREEKAGEKTVPGQAVDTAPPSFLVLARQSRQRAHSGSWQRRHVHVSGLLAASEGCRSRLVASECCRSSGPASASARPEAAAAGKISKTTPSTRAHGRAAHGVPSALVWPRRRAQAAGESAASPVAAASSSGPSLLCVKQSPCEVEPGEQLRGKAFERRPAPRGKRESEEGKGRGRRCTVRRYS